MKTLVKIDSERIMKATGKIEKETMLYISHFTKRKYPTSRSGVSVFNICLLSEETTACTPLHLNLPGSVNPLHNELKDRYPRQLNIIGKQHLNYTL